MMRAATAGTPVPRTQSMHALLLPGWLVTVAACAAGGLALRLTATFPPLRRVGTGLLLLALVLLLVLGFRQPLSLHGFAGAAGLVCAVAAVTARDHRNALLWFGGMTALNALLFLSAGAGFVAIALLVLMGGSFLPLMRLLPESALAERNGTREPLLSCLAGGLLLLVLTGPLHYALTVELGGSGTARRSALPSEQRIQRIAGAVPGARISPDEPHSSALAASLFTRHAPAVFLVGALTLVGAVGAALVAQRSRIPSELRAPGEEPSREPSHVS